MLRQYGRVQLPTAAQVRKQMTEQAARDTMPRKGCTPLVLTKAPWSQPVVVSGPCLNRKYWSRDRFFRFAVPGCRCRG